MGCGSRSSAGDSFVNSCEGRVTRERRSSQSTCRSPWVSKPPERDNLIIIERGKLGEEVRIGIRATEALGQVFLVSGAQKMLKGSEDGRQLSPSKVGFDCVPILCAIRITASANRTPRFGQSLLALAQFKPSRSADEPPVGPADRPRRAAMPRSLAHESTDRIARFISR
jgi:hypothetical protein